MKEEYRGYRPGDRVQMVERNDPYAPILPGEKGAIAHIDDTGTLHMRWDDGRTLGVCLEEDTVRKVPPEQEMELLSTEPLLQCDESQWDAHCEQSVALTGVMQRFAEEQGRDWVVKRSYIDEIHSPRPPKYQYVEAGALDDLIEGTCDLKKWNGRRFHGEAPAERAVHSDHRVWAGLHGAVGHASREGAARAQARLPPPPPRAISGSGSRQAGARAEEPPCSCSTRQATTNRLRHSSAYARNPFDPCLRKERVGGANVGNAIFTHTRKP